MYNEADMVTLLVSYKNEWFMLLNFFQYICQNQHLKIPIFMVYKATGVHTTNIKHESSVMNICH